MPYIKQEDRPKFQSSIELTLGLLKDPNDNPYLKGEFFGYFVNRLIRKFMATPDYTNPAFNSSLFNESKKKGLENAADSIAAALNRSDPMSAAGELNYSISSVYWGMLGLADGFASAQYGTRAYLNGVLDKIISQIETAHHVGGAAFSQKDTTMAFRRQLVVRGVLDHIKHETYRVLTVPYEEIKEEQNGKIWSIGSLEAPSGN
jgi:hypothetical protein